MAHSRLFDHGSEAVRAAVTGNAPGILAATSGSTGRPREVIISSAAMIASATATLDRLGGPGHWLLALPTNRIAGAMVHARALVGGTDVFAMEEAPFTPARFAAATARLPASRRYVSLVPTQVRRLLSDPAGAAALATYDAVLVGGAPPGMELPSGAIETYGMTETSGGCVYDGVPLAGVDVRISADGHVELAGPMLADGYTDGDNAAFTTDGGKRWFRTTDIGHWDGVRLTIYGRSDDVIITGGHNVHPAHVEQALLQVPGIADAVVTSIPDVEWGQQIAALVVTEGAAPPELAHLHAQLEVARHALPRIVLPVRHLPRTDAGKIDRDAARAYVTEVLRARNFKEKP